MVNSSGRAMTVFLLIAFGVPWIGWTANDVFKPDWNSIGWILFYTGSAASLGGLAATWVDEGVKGLLARLKSVFRLPASPIWWLFALLVPLLWVLGSGLAFVTTHGLSTEIDFGALTRRWAPATLLLLIPPLGEEFAWRGFLLPKLLERRSVLTATLIAGAMWAVWHMPLYFGRIESNGVLWAFLFCFNVTLMGFWIATVVLHTRSLFMALLMHFAINLCQEEFFFPAMSHANMNEMLIVSSVINILITAATLPLLLKVDKEDFLKRFRA